jgi:membrane-associated phospholipid phosphatase
MRKIVTNRTTGLSIVMLIFATQVVFEPLSSFSLGLIGIIHASPFNQFFIIITKFISYVVIYCCLALFVIQIIFISPHIVENMSTITFLCLTISINSLLKLVFGEIRPFMFGLLSNQQVVLYDCERDFGMPSGHVFFGICFYYLLRTAMFEEQLKINQAREVYDENHASFINMLRNPQHQNGRFKNSKFQLMGLEVNMKTFNKTLFVYIIILAFARVLAASHFTLQVLFGFLTGFSWGWIYFTYLRDPLRNFVYDVLFSPFTRPKSFKFINSCYIIYGLLLLAVYAVRKWLFDPKERVVIENYFLSEPCNSHIVLEDKNLLDALLGIVPALVLNVYWFFPHKKVFPSSIEQRPIFSDLSLSKNLLD